ncbi:hypothetical protein FPOAC1_007727 [Fusarium poae]|uniref:hypothetical protein n=1 Tax=Fusarium poae TaxID=36050 RepID=UPI001CEA41B2|nr:hypothetical protein FPOAC1_007727 [Fusarium poae]KAG8668348.1 hypothetical protein FPOAC1_007727 [Fusarium poae]
MKNRIRFSWFVKKDTKLRKRSGLPVNPNPPPLTSPSTAPAESQVTIATVPLAPAKEPSQAPDPDKEPSQVPDLGKESSQNEMPLDCMWAEAAKEFERICGDSLSNGDIKNFDDVKKQIEQQNLSFTEADADSKTKWEKAKGMGLETLKYLGAILPAASIAGSLAITSKALGLVLNIPQQNHDYAEAVDKVFREVSTALSEFDLYRKVNHTPLLREIHEVLRCLVKLCAVVVKHKQGGRAEAALKAFNRSLGVDNELQQQLVEFRLAMQNKNQKQTTVMFVNLEKVKEDAGQTKDMAKATYVEQHRPKILRKIGEYLDVPPTVNIDTTSTQTRKNISDKCFKNTGQWIWKHEDYRIWIGKDDAVMRRSMPHALLVLGAQSTGKTCTCAQITRNLEGKGDKDRVYVAHYFFPATVAVKKESDSDTNKDTISWAFRYMAFQIARVDATVRSFLEKACDNESVAFRQNMGSSEEELCNLWASFGIGASGSNATYYLVFDGLENLPDAEFNALIGFVQKVDSGKTSTRNLRILLSGKTEQFSGKGIFEKALKIRMGVDSQEDMQPIIKKELELRKVLLNYRNDQKQGDAMMLILDTLPSKVYGNYAELQLWLTRITEAVNSYASFDSLIELLNGPTRVYEAVIESLERTLTAKEIDQLNELLKHVIFRRFAPSLKQLEAVMSLHLEDVVSVEGLDTMIRHKYSSVLKIESDIVTVEEGFRDYLAEEAEKASNGKSSPDDAPSTISMTLTLNHVDRQRAAEYFWNLTQMAMQPNFTFDSRNNNQRQGRIAVDAFEAHLNIVNQTFKVLESKRVVEHQTNNSYLVAWLPYHLDRLRELENESVRGVLLAQQQRKIGEKLYDLFTNDSVFQQHKATFEQAYWVVPEMKSMQEWLMDPTVRRRDKDWLKNVLSAPSLTQGYLKGFTTWIVTEFVRNRTWEVSMAYRWIEELMDADTETEWFGEDEIDAAFSNEWFRVSEWCWRALGMPAECPDSLWYERLAKTASMDDDGDLETSLSIYQCAIRQANPSWLCYRDTGVIHHRQGQVKKAIDEVEMALREAEKSGAQPEPSSGDIAQLNLLLGHYAYETEEMESAKEYYTSACNKGDTKQVMEGLLGCLKINLNTLCAEETRNWLRDRLSGDVHQGEMDGVLQLMTQDPDHNDLFHMLFSILNNDDDLLKKIVTIMIRGSHGFGTLNTGAINTSGLANGRSEVGADGILLYYAGVAAHMYKQLSNGPESVFETTTLWTCSRKELENVRSDNAILVRSNASTALARHYFQLLLSNDKPDYIRQLEKLKPDDRKSDDVYDNDEIVGWLVAIHTIRERKKDAKKLLKSRLTKAISILSDDIPENDFIGLSRIHKATGACQDLNNAAIALSLMGQPDVVECALRLKDKDIDVPKGISKERALESYKRVTKNIISVMRMTVPNAAEQNLRIYVAKRFIELYIKNTTEAPKASDNKEDPSDVEVAKFVASELIKYRLDQIDVKDLGVPNTWSCDGRTDDGKECKKQLGFDEHFYHCLYCWQRDFCQDCFGRLRDSDSNVITVCNGGHKWLLTPRLGWSTYVGQRAKTVRVPRSVEPIEGDSQVLFARYDDNFGAEMTVKEWIDSIRNEYLKD